MKMDETTTARDEVAGRAVTVGRETEGAGGGAGVAESAHATGLVDAEAGDPVAATGEEASPTQGPEAGMATAEYAIATLAAAAFAGVLLVVLRSGEVRELVTSIIRQALSV